jgi:hypothetical protein
MLIITDNGIKPFQAESARLVFLWETEFEPCGLVLPTGPSMRVDGARIFARDFSALPEPKHKCLSSITPIRD